MRVAESVLLGHPDKLADLIADSIVDEYLRVDPEARVACEVMVAKDMVIIAGEFSNLSFVNVEHVARKAMREVGYRYAGYGIDPENCLVVESRSCQSKNLVMSLKEDTELRANDQAIVWGFSEENKFGRIPPETYLAKQFAHQIDSIREAAKDGGLGPDGKVLVAGRTEGCDFVLSRLVISVQHNPELREDGIREMLLPRLLVSLEHVRLSTDCEISVNPPNGEFTIGGPACDTGLTGRKIIADAYGPAVPHGGGAWSGKDYSKVDRWAAYLARWIACSLTKSERCRLCLVRLTYVIGSVLPDDVSVFVVDGESRYDRSSHLSALVEREFDLSLAGAIESLSLRSPHYQLATRTRHFGVCSEMPWELPRDLS